MPEADLTNPPKNSVYYPVNVMVQEILLSTDIAVELDKFDELTREEQCDRLHLERRVERAFSEAGKALLELRSRRLYRSTHRTFEEYCKDRFAYSRRQPYLLMDAAIVFDNLEQKCDQFDHILPTAEGQVRPLTKHLATVHPFRRSRYIPKRIWRKQKNITTEE